MRGRDLLQVILIDWAMAARLRGATWICDCLVLDLQANLNTTVRRIDTTWDKGSRGSREGVESGIGPDSCQGLLIRSEPRILINSGM